MKFLLSTMLMMLMLLGVSSEKTNETTTNSTTPETFQQDEQMVNSRASTIIDYSKNYYYVELPKKVNWEQALDYCLNNYNTHLATIPYSWDLNEIYSLWSTNYFKSAWIGLTAGYYSSTRDLDKGYGWEWVSGIPYTNNYFRESKKSRTEKCVRFKDTDRNPVWHNEKCSIKYNAFFCDRDRFN